MLTYVIGAGVTGLAFANAFGDKAEVLEGSNDLGGKARSYKVETDVGTFGFDIGGHWFHHRSAPEVLQLLQGLALGRHTRYAYVYKDRRFFDFPIQQSYKSHPDQKFVKTVEKELREIKKGNYLYTHYNDMLLKSYGVTLYNYFFLDYNAKMFGIRNLSKINIGKYEKVRNVRADKGISGYNSDFLYPEGDIGAKGIPLFLAQKAKIRFNAKVRSIDLHKKTIVVNKEIIPWETIISTIPLTSLVKIISDIHPEIFRLSRKLKSSKGMIINLGIKENPLHSNKSWVYMPSLEFHFHRVGFYSNVNPRLAPKGYSSIYVECSPLFFRSQKEALDLVPKVVEELIQIGFIANKKEVVTSDIIYLDQCYCFPDLQTTSLIRQYLEGFGVFSIGRYGTWHWSSQHEDMQQAVDLANRFKIDNIKVLDFAEV